jgi:hypothetical protein
MRRIVTTLIATLFAGVLLAGCSAGDDALAEAESVAADDAPDAPREDDGTAEEDLADDELEDAADGDAPELAVTSAAQVDPAPRQIIYTIDLAIETADVARSAARAAVLAEAAGGFVAHESTHGDESATLTLRVPVARHSSIVAELEKFGEVRERSRTAEDVTAEVVDVEARVASQRRSIERIRVLLDEATDLADVVRIESELARREAELDSLLQRRQQLGSLTSLATVTVTFYRVHEAPDGGTEEAPLGFLSGLSNGWSAFEATVRVVGTVVGALLPFTAVGALLGVPAWLLWRRFRPAHRAPEVAVARPGEPG